MKFRELKKPNFWVRAQPEKLAPENPKNYQTTLNCTNPKKLPTCPYRSMQSHPHMKRNRFIDYEAGEEDDEGNVTYFDDGDDEDEETEADRALINDEPEEEPEDEDDACSVRSSEKELDEDDHVLLQDHRRATRGSRIRRVEDSDSESSSDSFIEDDIGLYESGKYVEYTSEEEEPEAVAPEEVLLPDPEPQPKIPEPPPRTAAPTVKKPGMFSSFCAVELPKPQPPKPAASAWDFLKYREPVAKGAKPAPLSGMVRNADGLFYVTRAGKRIRVTEGSVNPTDRSPA